MIRNGHFIVHKIVLVPVCALFLREFIPGLFFVEEYKTWWRLCVYLTAALAAASVFSAWQRGRPAVDSIVFIILVLSVGLSGAAASFHHYSIFTLSNLIPVSVCLSCFYLARKREADPVVIVVVVALLLSFLMDVMHVSALQPLRVLRTSDGQIVPAPPGHFMFRWPGVFATPNVLGLASTYAFFALLPLSPGRTKMWKYALPSVLVLAILVSFSRGAIIATGIALVWLMRQLKGILLDRSSVVGIQHRRPRRWLRTTHARKERQPGSVPLRTPRNVRMISQISAKARGFFLVVYSMISVLVLMTIVVYIAHYMYGALEDEFSRVEEFGEDVNTRWALFATSATLSLRNPVWGLGEENYNVPGQIALGQNRGPHVWLLELSVCKGVPHSLLALFLVAWVYRVLRRGLSVHHVSSVRYASILIALLLYGLSGGFAGHQSIWSLLGYAFGIAHQPGASNNVAHSRSCGISAVRLLKAQDRAEAPVGRAPGGSE